MSTREHESDMLFELITHLVGEGNGRGSPDNVSGVGGCSLVRGNLISDLE